jgi:hypothetical protein
VKSGLCFQQPAIRKITVANGIEVRYTFYMVIDMKSPEQGNWYPACGGTETPFISRSGKRLQYMYQPRTGNHAYMDVDCDMIITDEEARAYMAW